MTSTVRLLVLASLFASACAEPPLLELSVVVPEGVDPFTGADEVRVVVTSPGAEAAMSLVDPQTLDISLELDVAGEYGQVVLEASAGGALIARGETPSFTLRPVDDAFGLLVGRAGAVAQLATRLREPRAAMLVAPLPAVGFLVAGGHDATGQPSGAVDIYDYWTHELAGVSTVMPEARAEGIAVSCGSTCALIALGRNAQGLASTFLSYGGGWAQLSDGLDAGLRRRRAAVAPLEDGSYLIVGGLGLNDEALNSMLRLRPGSGIEPTFTPLGQPARAARDNPAVASTGTAVVVVGGQAADGVVGEIVYPETEQTLELTFEGAAPVSGTAAAVLSSGKIVVVGGRDASGALIADGWIVDPLTQTVTHVANALAVPRAGHVAMVAKDQVLVLGGEDASGSSSSFEVLSASLRSLDLGEAPGARTETGAVHVGGGSVLLFGGLDGNGDGVAPVGLFESGEKTNL